MTTITLKKNTELIKEFGKSNQDSGSPEVQIAIFTQRINYLMEHFKNNRKDHHSRLGMIKIVNKRKKLLKYLKNKNFKRYQELIKKLGLRK